MHMVDERVAVADLETLTAIYTDILESYFGVKLGSVTAACMTANQSRKSSPR